MAVSDWTAEHDNKLREMLHDGLHARPLIQNEMESFVLQLTSRITYHATFHQRPSKEIHRIKNKVRRYREQNSSLSIDQALEKIGDMEGGRIILTHLEEVYRVYGLFCEYVKRSPGLHLKGQPDDHNKKDPNTSDDTGYRGLHQVVEIRLYGDRWFPFEVQFHTGIQAVWADIDHVIYENYSKLNLSPGIRDRMKSIAETLHESTLMLQEVEGEVQNLLVKAPTPGP